MLYIESLFISILLSPDFLGFVLRLKIELLKVHYIG